jgi:hypothetical protein
LHKTGGIGLGIVSIIKLKKHKENPTQILIGKPLNPFFNVLVMIDICDGKSTNPNTTELRIAVLNP